MTERLGRRERAAMVYAYELLRGGAHGPNRAWMDGAVTRVAADAKNALRKSGHPAAMAAVAAHPGIITSYRKLRVYRARLALLLRVLLRADAGDLYGWRWSSAYECADCGKRWITDGRDDASARDGIEAILHHEDFHGHAVRESRLFRPLWDAPAHEGSR